MSFDQVSIDFGKVTKVSDNLMSLLLRRTENIGEVYLASKFLTMYFELAYGFRMEPSDELKMGEYVKQMVNGKNDRTTKP